MEKLLTSVFVRKGEYVYDKKLETGSKYFMAFESKLDNVYNATLIYCGSRYGNHGPQHVYSVVIKVCGKIQTAVRQDNIYLFESIDEYNNFMKNKENKSKENMNNEQKPTSLLEDIVNEFTNYYKDYAKRYDGYYKNFWDNFNKANEDVKPMPITDGAITITAAGKSVSVMGCPTRYEIDDIIVDKDAYDKAMEVITYGGKAEYVINSIKDILKEYREEKKAAEVAAKENAARAAKEAEIKQKMAELQKELDELKK